MLTVHTALKTDPPTKCLVERPGVHAFGRYLDRIQNIHADFD